MSDAGVKRGSPTRKRIRAGGRRERNPDGPGEDLRGSYGMLH